MGKNKKIIIVLVLVIISLLLLHLNYKNKKVSSGVVFAGKEIGGKTKQEVVEIVKSYDKRTNTPPLNPYYDISKGKVMEGKRGRRVDVKATVNAVMKASKNEVVEPRYQIWEPDITKQDVAKTVEDFRGSKIIGEASTPILDSAPGRVNNIILAGSFISYRRIKPGGIFSFNKWIGEPTQFKGFKKAPVIDDGEFIPMVGGGICQVSTTLYNAVLDASLEVVERHKHSLPINYVEKGRDATVFPGEKDFKFKNNTSNEICIKSELLNRNFKIEILSK